MFEIIISCSYFAADSYKSIYTDAHAHTLAQHTYRCDKTTRRGNVPMIYFTYLLAIYNSLILDMQQCSTIPNDSVLSLRSHCCYQFLCLFSFSRGRVWNLLAAPKRVCMCIVRTLIQLIFSHTVCSFVFVGIFYSDIEKLPCYFSWNWKCRQRRCRQRRRQRRLQQEQQQYDINA